MPLPEVQPEVCLMGAHNEKYRMKCPSCGKSSYYRISKNEKAGGRWTITYVGTFCPCCKTVFRPTKDVMLVDLDVKEKKEEGVKQ